MPFFSIILPTYNRAGFLPETIKSVLVQTFTDWELIIIDDGSTDNTKSVVEAIARNDQRINYVWQENAERSAARNHGIRQAKGEYICFLDSDDKYLPNHLAELELFLKSKKYPIGLIHYGCTIIQGNHKEKVLPHTKAANENIVEYFFQNPIPPIRVCLHKNTLRYNHFDDDITIVEDTCLWMRIAKEFPVFVSTHIGVEYHLHDGNSVNRLQPSAKKMYDGLNIFLSRNPDIKRLIRYKVYDSWLSRIMTNIAIYHALHKKLFSASFWTLRAIMLCPFHEHTKFRIVLLAYVFGLKSKAPYE